MSKLVDIFLQPGRVFEAERERPTFLVPLAIVVLLTVAFTLAYFMRVDPAWYGEYMVANLGREVTAPEAAAIQANMPGARVQGTIGAVMGAIAVVAASAVVALYVWIAAKVTGRAFGFRHGMSLSAWSGMPMALGLLVALVGALTMAPQTALESLMLTHVDPLLVELPAEHRWNRLAQGFNLLTLWALALFALGWRLWTRSSWLQAIVVAVLPTLAVFGVIALIP